MKFLYEDRCITGFLVNRNQLFQVLEGDNLTWRQNRPSQVDSHLHYFIHRWIDRCHPTYKHIELEPVDIDGEDYFIAIVDNAHKNFPHNITYYAHPFAIFVKMFLLDTFRIKESQLVLRSLVHGEDGVCFDEKL